MKTKYIVPALILLAAGLFFYMNLGPATPDGYKDLDPTESRVYLAQNSDANIIDIRTPAEFKDGHIEGATMIDFYAPDYRETWSRLDRDAIYFIYCRTGNRSSQTLPMLVELGFKNIWHLKDGIVSWRKAGLPLVR